jgi:hypothetical protein
MIGDLLIHWTIRAALLACVGRFVVDLLGRPAKAIVGPPAERLARSLWTVACVLLWIHVASAFHFVHDWDQQAAIEQTARETAAVTGLNWGGGLWINYTLMLLWAADALWWWVGPQSFAARPAILSRIWLGFVLFIAFNATVVFKTGPMRWSGIAITTLLLLLAVRATARVAGRA